MNSILMYNSRPGKKAAPLGAASSKSCRSWVLIFLWTSHMGGRMWGGGGEGCVQPTETCFTACGQLTECRGTCNTCRTDCDQANLLKVYL